jgi:predicted RNase H-like HicB family nuclease
MAKHTVDEARPRAVETTHEVDDLRRRIEELEELVERFYDAIVDLQVLVIDGYFVKIWADPEDGGFVAECPTVRATSQGGTRDEALANITSGIEEMLDHLADSGHPVPAKDV